MKLTFITGGAGVGKSYTLKKQTAAETRRFVITAPTGIAAINANGVTLHSAFKIDPSNGFVSPHIKYGPLRGIEVIYIDEVSMVSAALMESVYNAAAMLGVKEIVAFGDLAQLKPVQGNWFFEFAEPTELQKLLKNYRQGGDGEFADILNRIRIGTATPADIGYLNNNKGDSDEGITLAFSNATVDQINRQGLESIDSPLVENAADLYGNISAKDVPAPELLQMKEGAKVVMLVNDRDKRFQNGTRATIHRIREEESEVDISIGDTIVSVSEHTWQKKVPRKLTPERTEYWEAVQRGEISHTIARSGLSDYETDQALAKHTLKNGYEMEVTGSFTQFPFKLGYASTVHKSQGLTLDKVIIRPDGFSSSHGLGYVALSRLTTLQGLTSYRKLRRDDFVTNPKVLPYL